MTDIEVKRRPLERAWVKIELIRHLAEGKKPQTELAKLYGVGQSAIAEFKRRHAAEVSRCQDSLTDEWAALWIANKKNRLAELQGMAEALLNQPPTARTVEVTARLLRDAAEELGDITNKQKVDVDVVRYEIEGINLEALK